MIAMLESFRDKNLVQEELPLGATGKVIKNELRSRCRDLSMMEG